MSRVSWIAGLCAASWLTAVPAANALPVKCDKSVYDVDLTVAYANGMLTMLPVAKRNLERLRPLVDERLQRDRYEISYAIAYNQKKGFLATIGKVIRERIPMSGANLIRMLNGLIPLPESLNAEIDKIASEVDRAGFVDDRSLEQHVTMYRDHLLSGRKVLVIAHSEGNMYANAAHARLFGTDPPTAGEKSLGIVGIATPTPRIAGWFPDACKRLKCPDEVDGLCNRGCYTTFAEDLVMRYVRKRLPDTAPPNVTGALWAAGTADLGWHGLEPSYLKTEASRKQILEQVAAFVDTFEPLEAVKNDLEVSATLTWSENADLDLHVREIGPPPHHLYGQYSTGIGMIDVDSRTGPGVEHYTATCAALQGGDLRFGVGYYQGEGPVRAKLVVKVGSSSPRSFEAVLDKALREGSFTNYKQLVTVKVTNRGEPLNARNELIDDDYEIEFVTTP